MSEITADATGMLPADKPSIARARKRKIALGANAAITNEIVVPTSEYINKGFRPNLSDNLPIKGADRNEQREKSENKRPFWKSDKPYFAE